MWEPVKRNLWTLIAEQNVLYMYCSRNLTLPPHKCGAESVDGNIMFENNSALALPIQPMPNLTLCTLAYEVVGLRFSRWEEVATRYPEFIVSRAPHYYSSNRKTRLWNTTPWLWLLRQHLLASIHWSAVLGGCPRLRVTCPVPEGLPHIKRLQLASALQIWFWYVCWSFNNWKLTLAELIQFSTRASQQCCGMR